MVTKKNPTLVKLDQAKALTGQRLKKDDEACNDLP